MEYRYIGLRPKKLCSSKQVSDSETSLASEYDSGSEYLPPNQKNSEHFANISSDDISYISDSVINVDKFIENYESKISQKNTSLIDNNNTNQLRILNNEVMESNKKFKKGYKINNLVETSKKKTNK